MRCIKLKTFNYESCGVKYRNCFFDICEYNEGNISLVIYGYVENDKEISHISNLTINNVEFKLKKNQVVIDNYSNTNLISFLLELGIIKSIITRVDVKSLKYPVVELDLDILDEYCYKKEELKYAS